MRRWLLPVLLALALSACSAAADPALMTVPPGPGATEAQRGAVWVHAVEGGRDTVPAWSSQIGAAAFLRALEDSLRRRGYLAGSAATARFRLQATILEVRQPLFALDMTVTTVIRYRFEHTRTGRSQTREITAQGTATLSDAFLGAARLKIANERSARENIRLLLEALLSLDAI